MFVKNSGDYDLANSWLAANWISLLTRVDAWADLLMTARLTDAVNGMTRHLRMEMRLALDMIDNTTTPQYENIIMHHELL